MKLVFLFLMLLYPIVGSTKPLVSDIAPRTISIDSTFSGTNVLMFGARQDAGDVVMVVRGPVNNYLVRKKERVAGVWVNRKQVMFQGIYGFYNVASSRPLEEIKNEYLLSSLGIGLENIEFTLLDDATMEESKEFSKALLTNQVNDNIYSGVVGEVSFMGETLFRSNIHFPENIPKGIYTVETYLLADGQLVGFQSTPIRVEQVGFDAFLYRMAYRHSLMYGILAVSIALIAGWLAGLIFRRVQ